MIDRFLVTNCTLTGSFILRMMNQFLGEETFRAGVSNYLKKHEFANAEQDDLWTSLTEEAHKEGTLPKNLTVKAIMDTWTWQRVYPDITFNRQYKEGTATARQVRAQFNQIIGIQ